MKNTSNYKGIILVLAMILFAAFSRILPHAPNFTAVGAIALFGAATLGNKRLALFVPLFTLWFSDLFINNFIYQSDGFSWFHSYQIFTLLAMALIVWFGSYFFNKISPSKVVAASIVSALIFFVVSNFGAWVSPYAIFPKNFMGLIDTYIAGLPFLRNDLAGTLFFSTLLFGSHYLITSTFPSLKLGKA